MKKLFLSMMLCASFGLLQATYVPADGPLTLGDAGTSLAVNRGAIMGSIVNATPQNANVVFYLAKLRIQTFYGMQSANNNFPTYQKLMNDISVTTKTQEAVNVVKSIEAILMHLYDYDTYLCGRYRPGQSIFVTGIRYNNIFFDDAKLKQLINELENLANVVSVHSATMSARLKMTVHSYRHWRRNLALTCAVYLAGDAIKHGVKDSIVNQFYQGGLSNSGEIAINHLMNFGSGMWYVGKGIGKGAQGAWSYGIKPVGKFVFCGKSAFVSTESTVETNVAADSVKTEDVVISNSKNKETVTQTLKIETKEQAVQCSEKDFFGPSIEKVANDLKLNVENKDQSVQVSEMQNAVAALSEKVAKKDKFVSVDTAVKTEREKYKAPFRAIGQGFAAVKNGVTNFVVADPEDELTKRQKELVNQIKKSAVDEFGKVKQELGNGIYNVNQTYQRYLAAAQEHREKKQKELLTSLNAGWDEFKAFPAALVKYIQSCGDDKSESN